MEKYSMNKVILVGRLGKDPEVRYTNKGDAVANLVLATTETWKTKNGEQKEKTEWHRIVVFRNRAEFARENLHKGAMIAVDGKLRTRKYEDKKGNKRYTTEVMARNIIILSSVQKEGSRAPKTPDTSFGKKKKKGKEEIPF